MDRGRHGDTFKVTGGRVGGVGSGRVVAPIQRPAPQHRKIESTSLLQAGKGLHRSERRRQATPSDPRRRVGPVVRTSPSSGVRPGTYARDNVAGAAQIENGCTKQEAGPAASPALCGEYV